MSTYTMVLSVDNNVFIRSSYTLKLRLTNVCKCI